MRRISRVEPADNPRITRQSPAKLLDTRPIPLRPFFFLIVLSGITGGNKRFIPLSASVAKAFGLLQDGNTDKDDGKVESQVLICGEGRCPVVPLVFKTSLGIVRSPEGSTPSLLRHQ
jgi:hypothetical protein